MTQYVVEDLVGDARPVAGRHRGFIAPQHALQRFDYALPQLPLVDVRVIERRAECLEQRGMHAALHPGERVGVPRVAANSCLWFAWHRTRRKPLRDPVGQTAHAVLLFSRRRASRPGAPAPGEPADGARTRRCRANREMARLTGCSRFASVIGVPWLIDSGTARLDGMCAAIGERSTRSTSSGLSPTLESDRLSTTDLASL